MNQSFFSHNYIGLGAVALGTIVGLYVVGFFLEKTEDGEDDSEYPSRTRKMKHKSQEEIINEQEDAFRTLVAEISQISNPTHRQVDVIQEKLLHVQLKGKKPHPQFD
jgi:hypothetical protein